MTTVIRFAGGSHTPAPRHPAVVQRTLSVSGPLKAIVETRHPQVGMLRRGTVTRIPSRPEDGALGRWQLIDYDHTLLGEVVGDYLDAETALLRQTSALDAVVTNPDTPEGEL